MSEMLRHYEIVFLIHPDQPVEQVNAIVDRYKAFVTNSNGTIHRFENWGRRQMSYPILKQHKAYYILMNVECNQACLEELKHAFRFNDSILRHLILKKGEAITEMSPMMRREESPARSPRPEGREGGRYDGGYSSERSSKRPEESDVETSEENE